MPLFNRGTQNIINNVKDMNMLISDQHPHMHLSIPYLPQR